MFKRKSKFPNSSQAAAGVEVKKVIKYKEGSVGETMEKLVVVFQEILDPKKLHQTKDEFVASVLPIITQGDLSLEFKGILGEVFEKIDTYPSHRKGKEVGHEDIRLLAVKEAAAMSIYYPFFGLLFSDPRSIAGKRKRAQSHFSDLTGIRLQAALAIADVFQRADLFNIEVLGSFLFDTDLVDESLSSPGFESNKEKFRKGKEQQIERALNLKFILPKQKISLNL